MFRRHFEKSFVFSSIMIGIANLYMCSLWISNYERQDDYSTWSVSPSQQAIHQIQKEGDIDISSISCIRENIICRFDDVGDFLESSDHQAIVHEPLPAIPTSRRIPHQRANDWQYILDQRARLPEDGSQTALMDYNTMLLPLYSNTKIDEKGR